MKFTVRDLGAVLPSKITDNGCILGVTVGGDGRAVGDVLTYVWPEGLNASGDVVGSVAASPRA